MESTSPLETCICALAYPGHPRTKTPNHNDELTVRISITIGAVSNNPIKKVSPKIHYNTTKTFHQSRHAFERHDIISKMIESLEIPFRLENIVWGTLDFPHNQTATKFENFDEIKARLLKLAENNQTGYMDIHIRKVDKLPQEDYQMLFEKNERQHSLSDWILENVNDVDLHLALGVIQKLAMRSPLDNKCFGLRSIKIKEELGDEIICPICRKDFMRGSQAIRMPCGHIFHGFCIFKWIPIKLSCPYCRFKLVDRTADQIGA